MFSIAYVLDSNFNPYSPPAQCSECSESGSGLAQCHFELWLTQHDPNLNRSTRLYNYCIVTHSTYCMT